MAEPVRLLVAGVSWPMETFLERLLRGLAGKGMQITLASEKRPAQDWLDETGIQWLAAPLWRGMGIHSIARLVFHLLRAFFLAHRDGTILWRATASQKNFTLRLTHWCTLIPFAGRRWDLVYFPWNLAAVHYLPLFELGMPVVLSCRGSQVSVARHNPRRAAMLPDLRVTFEEAAAVHCVSQDISEESISLGLDPAKAYIIRPAVDVSFFQPCNNASHPDGIFQVVTTGSLIWRKGLEYALLAIRQLKEAGVLVRFEIIGDGSERNRLLFTIEDLGLQDCVHLAGRLAPDEVRMRLQQADAFLLSSLNEGISNAVLEAMACGLPVVTTECGGMREAVQDGVEGFVVPVRSPEAMAEKLALLACQPDLRKRMGNAGRERIVCRFSSLDQIESFTSLFEHVLQENAK